MIHNIKIVKLFLLGPPLMMAIQDIRTVLHSTAPGSAFLPYDMPT